MTDLCEIKPEISFLNNDLWNASGKKAFFRERRAKETLNERGKRFGQ